MLHISLSLMNILNERVCNFHFFVLVLIDFYQFFFIPILNLIAAVPLNHLRHLIGTFFQRDRKSGSEILNPNITSIRTSEWENNIWYEHERRFEYPDFKINFCRFCVTETHILLKKKGIKFIDGKSESRIIAVYALYIC